MGFHQDCVFPGLEDDESKELMFCDYCIKAGVSAEKTNFVQGCPSLHIESIKKHEASNVHVFAAIKHKNEVTPNKAPAWKAKLSLNKPRDSKASTSFLICTCNKC